MDHPGDDEDVVPETTSAAPAGYQAALLRPLSARCETAEAAECVVASGRRPSPTAAATTSTACGPRHDRSSRGGVGVGCGVEVGLHT